MAIRIKENILKFYIPIYNPQLQTEYKKKYFKIVSPHQEDIAECF